LFNYRLRRKVNLTQLTYLSALRAPKSDEARKRRAEDRKDKRHAKAEAKQARKLNAKTIGKWTPERKSEMKLKTAANKPLKDTKRKKKLESKIEKLKIQAEKCMMQSRRAEMQLKQLEAQEVGFSSFRATDTDADWDDRNAKGLRGKTVVPTKKPTQLKMTATRLLTRVPIPVPTPPPPTQRQATTPPNPHPLMFPPVCLPMK
jgi:hypothetical protein